MALDAGRHRAGAEWRIHFHVPLFTAEYDGLGSTQDYVAHGPATSRARTRFARHFEIETYTWDVLPAGLKIDLLDSIGARIPTGCCDSDFRSAPDTPAVRLWHRTWHDVPCTRPSS